MGAKNLPLDSGRKITEAFERLGWASHRGKNHFVLTHPNAPKLTISIPDHKPVDRKLLHSEIRKAELAVGLTEEDFLKAYRGR